MVRPYSISFKEISHGDEISVTEIKSHGQRMRLWLVSPERNDYQHLHIGAPGLGFKLLLSELVFAWVVNSGVLLWIGEVIIANVSLIVGRLYHWNKGAVAGGYGYP